jgi:hypothetical protein
LAISRFMPLRLDFILTEKSPRLKALSVSRSSSWSSDVDIAVWLMLIPPGCPELVVVRKTESHVTGKRQKGPMVLIHEAVKYLIKKT